MPDPITVTAIVGFVFTAAAESVVGKATETVLSKLNELRKKIVDRLKTNKNAKQEIEKFEQNQKPDLEIIADYLKIAMREDTQFAEEINTLAMEINTAIEVQGQGTNIMNVYGGKAYQQNQNKGKIYNADTIHITEKDSERQ